MEEKLAYLKCLRDEIISGQRSRNTIVALKITSTMALVSYSFVNNLKLIAFSALIAVVLDYATLGISLMIRGISTYIRNHIESSFGGSFTGWETHIINNSRDIRKGRLLASLTSGSGLTLIIIVASFYGLVQNSSGFELSVFWIILFVSIVGWIILTILQIKL